MSRSSVALTVVSRWAFVIGLAGAGALCATLVLPFSSDYWRDLKLPSTFNYEAFRAALWVGLVLLGYLVAGMVPFRFGHFRFLHRYPPTWLALVLVIPMAAAADALIGPLKFADGLRPLTGSAELVEVVLPLVAGFVLAVLVGLRHSHRPAVEVAEDEKPSTVPISWHEIESWSSRERPAGTDFLEHRRIAARFASVLSYSPSMNRRSAALAGPWGSGKTTVLKWVTRDLEKRPGPKVLACWVSCWGIEDSRQLAAHVLRSVVETVNMHIDVLALRGVPDAYLRMLGATRLGPVEGFLRQGSERDVLASLSGLTTVLEAIDARVVLIVEDGDRASAADFDPGHLELLLWRLRDLPRISSILALDPKRTPVDLLRLCEHVEPLPPLQSDSVRTILRLTREHCLNDFKFVRLVRPGQDRDRLDLHQPEDGGLLNYVRRHHDKDVCDTIAALVETPRRLKHVVRRVTRVWESLHGEVDIDDLIAISVVKECCPTVFAFLLENIDAVRTKADDFNKRPAAAKAEWAALVAKDPQAAMATPLVRTLGLLQLDDSIMSDGTSLQRARVSEPSDYFRRILAEEVAVEEVRDQAVLADIDAWIAGRSPAMLEALAGTNKRYVRVWEYFASRVPNDRFVEVVQGVFSRLLLPGLEGQQGRQEGLMACWREHNHRHRSALIGPEILGSMIEQAMPESLTLANDLYYFWTSVTHGPYQDNERVLVREAAVRRAQELFTDHLALIRSLRFDQEGWGIGGLVIPADQDDPRSLHADPADWTWLVPVAIQALHVQPTLALQFANFLGDVGRVAMLEGVGSRYQFNRERAARFCGEHLKEFLTTLDVAAQGSEDWKVREAGKACQLWRLELGDDRLGL